MTDAEDIARKVGEVHATIAGLARACGRAPDSVRLVAASKTQPPAALRAAFAAGQRAFGENYLQEARAKQEALADLPIEWHFIGAIQGNKTAEIAARFDWVHTVDRARIANRLSAQRPPGRPPLKVLIEVNISGEASKHGCAPAEVPALAATIRALPGLELVGLMSLPAPNTDEAAQRAAFAAVAELAAALDPPLPELSMGTTADYAAAIAEGATLVRLGTAVFGPRA